MTRRLSTTLYQLQTKGAWDLLFEAAEKIPIEVIP